MVTTTAAGARAALGVPFVHDPRFGTVGFQSAEPGAPYIAALTWSPGDGWEVGDAAGLRTAIQAQPANSALTSYAAAADASARRALIDAASNTDLTVARQRAAYPFPVTPCASRLMFPNAGLLSQNAPTITYRSSHVVLRAGNVLRFGWLNQSFNGTASNAFTLTASVQVGTSQLQNLPATSKIRLTFNGSTSVTVPVGGFVMSDPIYANIEVGNILFVRSCCASAAASNNWPIGMWLNRFNEGTATGDQTMTDAAFSTGGQSYAPAMIGTQSLTGRWVVATGDSILDGSNDANNNQGFFDRWQLATNTPGTRLAVAGETIALGQSRIGVRWQMVAGASHAFSEGGGNDINGGATLAQVQASMIAHWRDLWIMGQRVNQATIMPRPTTTDNWITAANQTPWTADTVRTQLNTWLRAGAPCTASGSTFLAVAVGTPGAIPCPYLTGIVDWCATTEVNASNVLTLNGGRLIVGATLSTRTATGGTTTSLVDSGANFNALAKPVAGCLVRITSGQGAGQTNWIVGAASNTQINLLNTWVTAPNATSVYEIIDTPTRDGTHPSPNLHQTMADYMAANYAA